jgi:Uma2 family endonuclease
MATATPLKLMTAEEFMAADLGEGRFELIRGEIVEMSPPPMPAHGRVQLNVGMVLELFGRQSGFGYAVTESAVLTERGPDTVRGADVCFYSQARWPRSQVGNTLPPVPPDLAVEVVSPGNRIAAIMTKIGEYLRAGVTVVWVVYPKQRQVVIYRANDDEPVTLDENDVIENLPELPGFRCAVSDFFV